MSLTARDGPDVLGTIAAENARRLTLRVIGRETAIISKSDIQPREATAVSMMPPGLFDALT